MVYNIIEYYYKTFLGRRTAMFKRLKALSIVPFVLFLSGCFLLGVEITVNFDVQGGVPIEPMVYTISTNQSVYSYLPTPVKQGHTFVGWYAGTEGVSEINVSQAVEGQLFVYARWEVNEYIFDVQRPDAIGSIDFLLEYDSEIPVNDLEVLGYTLDGLYWDEEYTNRFNFDRLPGEDITVYAKYTPNVYNVTFNNNLLNNPGFETIGVEYTDSIPYPILTQPEATFAGWYTGNVFTTEYTQETMPPNNLQLYAKWDYNQYPISYYLNEGTNISGVTRTSIDYGSQINLTPPTRPGYLFKGWFENEALTTPSSISVMPNTSVALYAKWELRDYEVVVFEESSLEFIQAVSNYQSSIYLDARNQLYVFGNLFGTSFNTLTNITHLVPLNEDEFITDVQLGYSALMILTNQGSVFTRGYNNNLGVGNIYVDSSQFNNISNRFSGANIIGIHHSKEVSFAWSEDGRIFIYGDGYNNKLIGETQVNNDINSPLEVTDFFELNTGETIVSIVNGERSGYALSSQGRVFAWGSNDERQLTGEYLSASKPIDITGNFALQTGETIVKIEAGNYNGFALTSNGRLLGWGARWDNMVIRWYESPVATPLNLTGDFALSSNEVIVDIYVGDRVGYAVTNLNRLFSWGNNQDGQLGSNSNEWMNGGYLMNANFDIASDETIQFISAAHGATHIITTEGRLFVVGSNRESRLPIPRISANIPFEIKIYDWKAITTSIYNYEDVLEIVTPKAIVGYTFESYYLDSDFRNALSFTAMPDQNLNLYPKYIANEYPIEFVGNGAVTIPALTVSYESTLNLPRPSRYGYTFEGWYEDQALTKLFEEKIMPAEALTLYAAWEPVTFTVDYYANTLLSYEKVAVSDDATLFIIEGNKVILFGLYNEPNGLEGYDITELLGLLEGESVTDIYPAREGFFLVTSQNRLLAFAKRNHNAQFGSDNWGVNYNSLTILNLTELVGLNQSEQITKIELGGWGSVAVLTSNHRIIMWGYPHHDTFVDNERRYELSNFLELNQNEVFTDIYYGESSTLVRTSENRVFVWGQNWNGRLGNGNNNQRTTPFDLTERLNAIMGVDAIKLIHMGNVATVIVTDDDLIYKAGGIIGDQNTFTLLNAQIDLNNDETIVEVQSTNEYIIVRTNHSRVLVYGYKQNSFLSLLNAGNNWEINQFEDIFKETELIPGESIVSMAVTNDYAIFITSNKEAFFIGSANWYEEIVDGFGPFELQTIDYEGWTLYEREIYGIDEAISLLDQSKVTDFTLNGWFTSPSLNTTYQGPLENINIVLYGDLEGVPSVVTFEVNGGNQLLNLSGMSSDKAVLPTPTRSGYNFRGWYLDSQFSQPFTDRRLPGGELTLYAKWESRTYTIDYYSIEVVTPKAIAASENNVLMITEDGRLIVYGSALFQGDSSVDRDLTDALRLRPSEEIVSIHVGTSWSESPFMIVTSQGRIFGLGYSSNGLLSVTPNYDWGLVDKPTDLTNKLNLQNGEMIEKLELTQGNAIVLTSLGRVIVWGNNGDSGVLGVGHFNWGVTEPTDITASFNLESNDRIVDISLGDSHAMALSEDGKVFIWGDGTTGELGNNRTEKINKPTELDSRRINLDDGETIIQILTGERLSYLRTSLNRVLVFGNRYNSANLDTSNSNVITPLDVTNMIPLGMNETISGMTLDFHFLTIHTSLGNTFYAGYFNGIGYQSLLSPLENIITLRDSETIQFTSTFYNYGVLLTNLGNVYVGGNTLNNVLSGNFTTIQAFIPTVYTLVETQEYSFGEILNLRDTSSTWLDVEILSDLDISDPITYTTMPDQDLSLYESLSE